MKIIQIILIICSTIISLIFLQIKHPLAIGLTLVLQTFLICIITGLIVKTFWFSYVLFLIFLGGILVLFIYVTALASNEIFIFSIKTFLITSLIITITIITIFIIDKSFLLNYLINIEILITSNNFLDENTIDLNKIYNFPTNIITLLLINYLFLTLIVVVKITNNFFGPLRPKR